MILFSLFATLVLFAWPGSAAAYIVGFPYLIFIPGFAVVRLFFWKGTSQEAKFVLSIGLSILVLIFLGLILVFTIGLSGNTTRASLVLFALGAVAVDVLWKRPAEKPKEDQVKKAPEPVVKTIKLDKVVAAMLGTALVVSAISLGLIITAEQTSRTYFAITDENGSVLFNTTRAHNSTLTVLVEMKNGEEGPGVFKVVIYNVSWGIDQGFSYTLQKGEVLNQTVDFYLDYYGTLRIDFDLYITQGDDPEYFYGNLHLIVEVD